MQRVLETLQQRDQHLRVMATVDADRRDDGLQHAGHLELRIEKPWTTSIAATDVKRGNAAKPLQQYSEQIDRPHRRARIVDRWTDRFDRNFRNLPHAVRDVGAGKFIVVKVEAVEHFVCLCVA